MKKEMYYLSALLGICLSIYFLVHAFQVLYQYMQPSTRFLRSLAEITQRRNNEGFQGKQALVIALEPGSRLIVLGHIFGNDQSLNHILNDLIRRQMISVHKKLADKTYMVVNGTLFDSPTAHGEVLITMMQLMKHNPQSFWLLRGPHDTVETLRTLSLFNKELSFDQKRILEDFFTTLPLALYVLSSDLNETPLRISPYGKNDDIFRRIACYPTSKEGPLKSICYFGGVCHYSEGKLIGTLDSDPTNIAWDTMKGLQRVGSEWHLISSPSQDHTRLHGYTLSSYAVITLGATMASSTITWHYAPAGSQEFVEGVSASLESQS